MTNRYTNVPKSDNKPENVVIIRGGGDLASGTIHRLYRCGYRLLVLECEMKGVACMYAKYRC